MIWSSFLCILVRRTFLNALSGLPELEDFLKTWNPELPPTQTIDFSRQECFSSESRGTRDPWLCSPSDSNALDWPRPSIFCRYHHSRAQRFGCIVKSHGTRTGIAINVSLTTFQYYLSSEMKEKRGRKNSSLASWQPRPVQATCQATAFIKDKKIRTPPRSKAELKLGKEALGLYLAHN